MIEINDITVRIGSKVLLEHASAHISDGQKVGLVGANGCGKSTLFRVLKGELETETGSVFSLTVTGLFLLSRKCGILTSRYWIFCFRPTVSAPNFCKGWRPRPAMNLPKFTSA